MDFKVVACLLIFLSIVSLKLAFGNCINNYNDLVHSNIGSNAYNPYAQNAIVNQEIIASPSFSCQGNQGLYNSILEVIASSGITPGQITVSAENLVIDGPLAVSGSLPVYGGVSLNGNLPTSGQATLSYNSGTGVTLEGAGCGQNYINYNGLSPVFNGPQVWV